MRNIWEFDSEILRLVAKLCRLREPSRVYPYPLSPISLDKQSTSRKRGEGRVQEGSAYSKRFATPCKLNSGITPKQGVLLNMD